MAEQDESFWEKFDDMVGGDNDYFAAKKFLTCNKNQRELYFVFCYGANIQGCLVKAEQMASELLEEQQQ